MKLKKLTKFECGYICCLANLVAGHGTDTDSYELYRDIGFIHPDRLLLSGLSEYDYENIKTLWDETEHMRKEDDPLRS